jgi:hypothetical protein
MAPRVIYISPLFTDCPTVAGWGSMPNMDERDISAEQAQAMAAKVSAMLRYLSALKRRLDERHFPPQDRFRKDVERAHDSVHRLWVTLHYLGCGDSVGMNRKRRG